jgi:hypothetical protein
MVSASSGFIHFRYRVSRRICDERSAMFPPFLRFLSIALSASVRWLFGKYESTVMEGS